MSTGLRSSVRWPGLAGAADKGFARQGGALLYLAQDAPSREGALAQELARALDAGTDPQDMAVLCDNPSAAARLRQLAGKVTGAEGVRVATCREMACEVLGRPRSAEVLGLRFPGGRVRILSAYETDFLAEDIKTLGTQPKRLRELLKFLYRGWTELSDEDPDWLFTVEEIDTLEFLTRELLYLGAVMEPQISNLATKALRLDGELRGEFGKAWVCVCGYQNLSRASQLMCQLVAQDRLVAIADNTGPVQTCESYPYPEGLEAFSQLNSAAEVVGAEKLDSGSQCKGVQRTERVWDTPEQEAAGIAEEIASAVAAGCAPADIAVVTPHPWWTRQVARELAARGVQANSWLGPMSLRGDIRELDRCLALRIAAVLRLLADPCDGMGWRSWFGFGDYLGRSNLFVAMSEDRQAQSLNVGADLVAAGYDVQSELGPVLEACRELHGGRLLGYLANALASGDGQGGAALAGRGGTGPDIASREAQADLLPPALRPLLELGDQADAKAMVEDLDRRQFFSGLPERPGVVVAPLEALSGAAFGRVYVVGFVNGLFPSADYFDLTRVSVSKQAKIGLRDAKTAQVMANMGRDLLCVSRFTWARRAFAERVGIRQARIFAADDSGSQLSQAQPSIYTDVLLGRG